MHKRNKISSEEKKGQEEEEEGRNACGQFKSYALLFNAY